MHHTCHSCNATVADAAPFCGHCRAPQVRVSIPDPVAGAAPVVTPPPTAPPLNPPPTVFVQDRPVETLVSAPLHKIPIRWAQALPRCAVVGLSTTLFTLLVHIPLVVVLLLPLGGAAAVWFHLRTLPDRNITTGQGAVLGAVTGFFAFIFYAVVLSATVVFAKAELVKSMREAMEKSMAGNPDPAAQQMMQKLMSPEGFALLLVLALVFIFFIFVVFCSTGGAAGAALLRRKE